MATASNIKSLGPCEVYQALSQSSPDTRFFSLSLTQLLIHQVTFPVFHDYLCCLSDARAFQQFSEADKIKLTVGELLPLIQDNPIFKPYDEQAAKRAMISARLFPHRPVQKQSRSFTFEERKQLHQINREKILGSLSVSLPPWTGNRINNRQYLWDRKAI